MTKQDPVTRTVATKPEGKEKERAGKEPVIVARRGRERVFLLLCRYERLTRFTMQENRPKKGETPKSKEEGSLLERARDDDGAVDGQ